MRQPPKSAELQRTASSGDRGKGRRGADGPQHGCCWRYPAWGAVMVLARRGPSVGRVTASHVVSAVGRFTPRLVPRPWRAWGPDTLWQSDGMQMELRKGAYLSLYISPPSTPAVCHAPSTPSPFGPHQPVWPLPPTSGVRLRGGHKLIITFIVVFLHPLGPARPSPRHKTAFVS